MEMTHNVLLKEIKKESGVIYLIISVICGSREGQAEVKIR